MQSARLRLGADPGGATLLNIDVPLGDDSLMSWGATVNPLDVTDVYLEVLVADPTVGDVTVSGQVGGCAEDATTLCLGHPPRFEFGATWLGVGGGAGGANVLRVNASTGVFSLTSADGGTDEPPDVRVVVSLEEQCVEGTRTVRVAATDDGGATSVRLSGTDTQSEEALDLLLALPFQPITDASAISTCP